MNSRNALVGLLLFAVALGGCFGGGGNKTDSGPDYVPQTRSYEMVIAESGSDGYPLYTLNDGVSTMNVFAMGFDLVGDAIDGFSLPNPLIWAFEGDTIEITVTNNNALAHTLHFHGGLVNWTMDGVPFLSQDPLHMGDSLTYVFENVQAGTFFYHCHVDVAHHMDLGMYGPLIVYEVDDEEHSPNDGTDLIFMLDEWDNCHVHGNVDPVTQQEQSGDISGRQGCLNRFVGDTTSQNQQLTTTTGSVPPEAKQAFCENYATLPPDQQEQLDPIARQMNCEDGHFVPPPQQQERKWYPTTFPLYLPIYNTFLMNGKAFPDTTPIVFEEGKSYRLRLINAGEEWHSMHLHGHKMQVIALDGYRIEHPYYKDTISIGPGERVDVLVDADNPGFWAFHDHRALNVANDRVSPGGMFTVLGYGGSFAAMHEYDPYNMTRSIDMYDAAQAAYGGGHAHG